MPDADAGHFASFCIISNVDVSFDETKAKMDAYVLSHELWRDEGAPEEIYDRTLGKSRELGLGCLTVVEGFHERLDCLFHLLI